MILYSKVCAEVPKECVVKLSSVIRYQYLGHSESAYNVLPHEMFNILLCDRRQRFSFHSFCEVIDAHN